MPAATMPSNESSNAADSLQVQAVFGPVSIVRAVPSREVTIISIEAPEEFHVRATNLLYGRDTLIRLATNPTDGQKMPTYGILGAQDMARLVPQELTEDVRFVHGNVFDVRALRSKGVTLISIEVPEHAHVEVTQMLYGRDVLLLACDLGQSTPYGVVQGRGKTVHTHNPSAGSVAASSAPMAPRPPASGSPSSRVVYPSRFNSMFTTPKEFDMVKWAGARCTEPAFQSYLGVDCEQDAVVELRRICGIESRRELATDPVARRAFMERIYRPYTQDGHENGSER